MWYLFVYRRRFLKRGKYNIYDTQIKREKKEIWLAASNIEQVLEAAPHKAAAVRPPPTHNENYQN